jgi:GNAT superfamily N-acetyltransferase
MIKIQKIDRKVIENLREEYLDSLPFPQELYLELFCREADSLLVSVDITEVGYLLMLDSTILEFYVIDEYLAHSDEIFIKALSDFNIKNSIAKSFDFLIMSISLTHSKSSIVEGCLFRDFIGNEIEANARISHRLATINDFEMLKNHMEEVFDHEQEILDVLHQDGMNIYSIDEKMIGYGIFQRSIEGRNSFDIGMYVVPDERKKGYGSYIINDLRLLCKQNGWYPTLGCDINNIGSRKTLEKAGFVSKHRIVEFTF